MLLAKRVQAGCAWLMWSALASTAAPTGLHWEAREGFQSVALAVPAGGQTGFSTLATAQTGLNFTNTLALHRGVTNQVLFNGSGLAAGDYDGDGWCDLYFCALDGANMLFRNLGSWKFERVTNNPALSCAEQPSTGAVFADVEGDGDLDLLVSALGVGVRLFANQGEGKFEEQTASAGLAEPAASMSLALADIEGDGDLDLYVANYRVDSLQDQPNTRFSIATQGGISRVVTVDGRPASTPELRNRFYVVPGTTRVMENGEPDSLFLNDGTGHFHKVSWTDGRFRDENGRPTATPLDWGLSVMFRDINQDGAPDLYVCNDGDSPDRIWINNGRGGFHTLSTRALRKTSFSSMGVDFADLNGDGWDEIFVTDMLSYQRRMRHTQMFDRRPPGPSGRWQERPAYMQNTLFLNRGDGTYAEIAQMAGIDASDWSWSPVFLDVDLDGYEDLLITTGLSLAFRDADARRRMDQQRATLTQEELARLRAALPPLDTPNYAFRNRGDLTFEEVSTRWGFDSKSVGNGVALADLDNDGDLDVALNCLNAAALVCRNESSAPRLAVRLRGQRPNTRGVGARIMVHRPNLVQSQEMLCGGRFVSSDEPMRVFAAGPDLGASSSGAQASEGLSANPGAPSMRIEVIWRSGVRSVVEKVEPNRLYEIAEPAAGKPTPIAATNAPRWFEDRSPLLAHLHQDAAYNEFARQPSQTRQLSRSGPGLAWFDLDGNGFEDLLVPGGRGSEMTVFLADEKGGFQRLNTGELTGTNRVDQGMVLGLASGTGTAGFLVSLLNYEGGDTNVPPLLHYEISASGARQVQAFPGQDWSAGPIALGDVDGDGDLDLFMGGRVRPAKYPQPVPSVLYRREADRWVPQPNAAWRELGLVSAALFTDLDGDGLPELVLACEWGPVKVFANQKGTFRDATSTWGLESFSGWWNSVAAGDFDGDGRIDLVAGNWGRNTKYQRHLPVVAFYGDVEDDGIVEFVEAHHDSELKCTVPWRLWDTLVVAMPDIVERCASYASYSTAAVERVLGPHFSKMKRLEARTLDSMLFLNRGPGQRLEARPLPSPAQVAPVFGLAVADFDGDGVEDIFMAQNFFGVDVETSRYDAGRGLILRGIGHGNLERIINSGVEIYGEQRGAAVCDYDADGRSDLAVAQNDAETKLYRNSLALPGLRVRMAGPPGNPTGVGAQLRLGFGAQRGPAREVHAGSGYWSQDSSVLVLATPVPPTTLWIRWPGGKEATATIPEGAREVIVDFNGRFGVVPR